MADTKYKLVITTCYAHDRRHAGRILRSFVWDKKEDAEACKAALDRARAPAGVTYEFLAFTEPVPMTEAPK